VFPAVALTQIAASVELVKARSGYIVLNTQFAAAALKFAWVSNQWFENFVLEFSMLSWGATHQSQVAEIPMAIWPEQLVMKSALAVVASPRTVAVLTAQQPPNTVF
jgi:hypothetical protein